MSLKYSLSTSSTSSSATMSTTQPNEQPIDPSNILYNDRQHYQIIFTNDSRFFDTSLHLFKSYCDVGYIKLDNKKKRKSLLSSSSTNTLRPLSNGVNIPLRTKSIGFSSNHDNQTNSNGALKTPFLRNHDHLISQRSDSGVSKFSTPRIRHTNSPMVVIDQRHSLPYNEPLTNDDSSDDPDVIITRL